ncbi:hypothetical protein CRG98_043298 [Punica granatum]|uniref:Uncharacterized protein n=1 Tax=Punica granatum TaxID=22663 RepID=A0A2I0HX45_PUNGR|nr:hypothetical protein CRG98_043298 [Punica granatum]
MEEENGELVGSHRPPNRVAGNLNGRRRPQWGGGAVEEEEEEEEEATHFRSNRVVEIKEAGTEGSGEGGNSVETIEKRALIAERRFDSVRY